MDRGQLQAQRAWVRSELDGCVNFWLEHGMDQVNGGVYTCLDRAGNIYSTDKSVWMQGRCAWTYSNLCRLYGVKAQWLDAARSCLDFLEAHCVNRAKGNRLYFTVTGDGRALRQRRYCFSEGFYAIANAEYGALTGDERCIRRARDAYEMIWKLNGHLMEDPVGLGPKVNPETRAGRALANPMIYLNISSVLRRCDPANARHYDARADACVEEIFRYHHKPEMRCTLECVGTDGGYMGEVTEGRVVNPGHDIECSWFLMEYARAKGDGALLKKALEVFDFAIEAGWDSQYGGLLYFIDCEGKPTEAYEHDMKLWWPHTEILIAALMAYRDTGEEKYYAWFCRTLEYCKRVFSDPQYGEWYGYLRRDGMPTMPPTKGSTFKGPFHLPRMLMMVDKMLDELLDAPPTRA